MHRLALLLLMIGCKSDKPAPIASPPPVVPHDASIDALTAEELARVKAQLHDHTPPWEICEKDANAPGCDEYRQRKHDAEAARKKLKALQEEAAKQPTHGPKAKNITREECKENPLAKGCDEMLKAETAPTK